jgi:phosphocarrier protein
MIITKSLPIKNKLGLHARPSASFVKLASTFSSEITVEYEGARVNGKSILGLLLLGASSGKELYIEANGEDAKKAIQELSNLVESKFDEE